MPFYVARRDSQWIFKLSNRLLSPTPYAVFEAQPSTANENYLDIVEWQKYRPPRPGCHINDVVEVDGPARGVSKEEWEALQ